MLNVAELSRQAQELESEQDSITLDHPQSIFNELRLDRITTTDKFRRAYEQAYSNHLLTEFLERVEERAERANTKIAEADSGTDYIRERWTKLQLSAKQRAYYQDLHRFQILPAGRRSGKTAISKRKFVRRALNERRFHDAWFIAAAPTHNQAKRIYWNDFKRLIPPEFIRDKSEGELVITLTNGAMIQVMGMDVPERAEGNPIRGILLDEYGNMKPHVWTAHIRPSLADRNGFAWFIGAPEGRNHYYDVWTEARADTTGQWGTHTWTTEEILPLYLGQEQADLEILSAKHDMDPLTYDQEYRASFVVFSGLAYYTFRSDQHAVTRCEWNPLADLILCFDFNVAPGVAVVAQESKRGTKVIGEVHIPNNSNTPMVCRKIIADYKTHEGDVYCYGDATGGNRGTAKLDGSDWDLIKRELGPVFNNGRLKFRVDKQNGPERSRVNAVNSRLQAVDGNRSLWVDPRCKWTVRDFEGVRVKAGTAGEIDKDHDKKITHLTDALGYYIVKRFPIAGGGAVGTNRAY